MLIIVGLLIFLVDPVFYSYSLSLIEADSILFELFKLPDLLSYLTFELS